MSRRRLLATVVVVLFLIGGGARVFLLASPLAPSARARAAAFDLDVQSIAPGSLKVFHVAPPSAARISEAVVAVRSSGGDLSFWVFPSTNGLPVMPHASWRDLAVTCARLEVSRTSGSATEEIRCPITTSTDFPILGRWRWRLDGSPAVDGIPHLKPARVGLVRGKYLLGANDEGP